MQGSGSSITQIHMGSTHRWPASLSCQPGERLFYYSHHAHNRNTIGRDSASLRVFLEAWRIDVPRLVVAKSICKISKCGSCEYLKYLIDKTPRHEKQVMQMYLGRLGQHFEFQSAQRLLLARVEELATQSGGSKWLMLIDKNDQNACANAVGARARGFV